MSQEIVYTSAPQGLKAGSRGFCTVLSTAGMAANLAERLEGLSGYRHAYAAHEANSAMNPVNYSHVILAVGGRRYHVLSSVRDAGTDYSQRSNKLAHHVALDQSECVPAGPAWVLYTPGFCETRWNGQTGILPTGRRPTAGAPQEGPCRSWQKLTKDAGWAGVLAETALEKGGRPMSIIFPPGTDVLPLVVESMNLLPPERRWDVTFSTYFTKQPAGSECQWRFLLEDSPEAQALRRNPHVPLIDLCRPLPAASGGALVEVARSGGSARLPLASGASTSTSDADQSTDIERSGRAPPIEIVDQEEADELSASLCTTLLPNPAFGEYSVRQAVPRLQGIARSQPGPASRRRLSMPMAFALTAVGILSVTVALLLAVVIRMRPIPMPAAIESSATEQPASRPQHGQAGITLAVRNDPSPNLETNSEPNDVSDRSVQIASIAKATDTPEPATSEEHASSGPSSEPMDNPLRDVLDRNRQLNLPQRQLTIALSRAPEVLATLVVKAPTECSLELIGGNDIVGSGKTLTLQAKEVTDDSAVWAVIARAPSAVGDLGTEIAAFTVKGGNLAFSWDSGSTAPWHNNLRYCLLRVTVRDKSETCLLTKPKAESPLRVVIGVKTPVALPFELENLPAPDKILLAAGVSGYTGGTQRTAHDLRLKKPAVVQLRSASAQQHGDPRIDLIVALGADDKRMLVQCAPYGYFAPFQPNVPQQLAKESLAPQWLEKIAGNVREHLGKARSAESEVKGKIGRQEKIAKDNAKTDGERAKASTELVSLKAEKQQIDASTAAFERQEKWCTEMQTAIQDIKTRGRLEYRIYVVIQGTTVSIIETEGMRQLEGVAP